jgi:hypothetical protein
MNIKSRAVDDSGNLEVPGPGITVAVVPQTCPCNLWPSVPAPAIADAGAFSPLELGVEFWPDSNGYITGIRFYKSATNTGTHIGSLWSNSGALLASATFTGETTAGWQQVNFANPVPITANTVYVASYHTDVGHFSGDLNYFGSAGVDASPLHAPADGSGHPNGLYTFASTSAFPAQTYYSSNFWVDVVFNSNLGGTQAQAPTFSSLTLNPTSVVGGTQNSTGTVTLSSAAPAGGAVVMLSSNNSAARVPASVIVPAGARSATFTVNTSMVLLATTANISATYNGTTRTASLGLLL